MRYPIPFITSLITTTPALAHEQGPLAMGMIGGIGHMLLEHTALTLILPLFVGMLIFDRWQVRRARALAARDSKAQ